MFESDVTSKQIQILLARPFVGIIKAKCISQSSMSISMAWLKSAIEVCFTNAQMKTKAKRWEQTPEIMPVNLVGFVTTRDAIESLFAWSYIPRLGSASIHCFLLV